MRVETVPESMPTKELYDLAGVLSAAASTIGYEPLGWGLVV